MRRTIGVAVALLAAASVGVAQPARAATVTQEFTQASLPIPFAVPAGVASLTFELHGGGGGSGGGPGGNGARVVATQTVTPGETLHVVIGGPGANSHGPGNGGGGARGGAPGGFGVNSGWGGGGGGGETHVLRGGTTMNHRVLVAAGGGGSGGMARDFPGGLGGAGGAGGHTGGSGTPGHPPGFGGLPGAGATPSTAGAGGTGPGEPGEPGTTTCSGGAEATAWEPTPAAGAEEGRAFAAAEAAPAA